MSDIRANTISDAAGTGPIELYKQSAAKAWCTVDRGTNPVSFFESFGMTTVSDLGIGIYQVNFTTALNTTRYPCSGACYTTDGHFVGVAAEETLRTTIRSFNTSGPADADRSLIVHGDLA